MQLVFGSASHAVCLKQLKCRDMESLHTNKSQSYEVACDRDLQDYCGCLSEDAIRKNFPLIYELLDEVIDYGTPQSTGTEALKTFVLNEPTVVMPPVSAALCM
jgi:hypothetical protein